MSRIVLAPGHGLNKEGKYSRPLIDCRDGGAKIINVFTPHELDGVQDVYREDFGTLAIAKATQEFLEDLGHEVWLTREDNKNAALYLANQANANQWKRNNWAKWKWVRKFTAKKKADAFIAIHTNATKTGRGKGCAAFWAENNGRDLAEDITNEIHNQLELKIRRIARHKYAVLKGHPQGRTCLIECLFHDNPSEVAMLLNEKGIRSMGKALATGINKNLMSV